MPAASSAWPRTRRTCPSCRWRPPRSSGRSPPTAPRRRSRSSTRSSACSHSPNCRGRPTSPTRWLWPSPASGGCACGDGSMIASLSGLLRRRLDDRIVLETGGVGYEVFLPPIVMRQIEPLAAADGEKASELSLVTHYHATRDQPRPVLIGFTAELDKEFFEKLITVKDMGPMVAARALAVRSEERRVGKECGGWRR